MLNNNNQEKIVNFILAGLVVAVIFVLVSCGFDFYYDLNDDMVIKDILSGAYTGTPSGYTNQMLYPLGWVLSVLYLLLPNAPVFGIFLCTCFGMSFFMITYRVQKYFQKKIVKGAVTVLLLLLFPALMLWELVYVQYSVACGVLAGTACFWFCTTPVECSKEEFWKENIPALLLVWLAFMVRSEMMLLAMPFVVVVGMWHWIEATKLEKENSFEIGAVKITKYIFSKENMKKYIVFVLVMLFGMSMLWGADSLAYGDSSWQKYRGFFDARTKVYDYTWYPNYEEQQLFYEEQGVSKIQYTLIDNYNFGLDESIDATMLEKVASYNEKSRIMGSKIVRVKNAIYEIVTGLVSMKNGPYNYFVLASYGLIVGLVILQKDRSYLWKLTILLIMRMVPWMYLSLVGRVVNRIAHPLYMIEFFILLALLVQQLYDRPLWNVEKYYRMLCAAVLAIIAGISLPLVIGEVNREQQRRAEILINQQALDDYAKENAENYYYVDVYSTVSFVEKMFEDVDNNQKNYDILGGWLCHSPLQKEAVKAYISKDAAAHEVGTESSADTMADHLLSEPFYFVIAKNSNPEFLEELYKEKGINVTLELKDTVGEGENPFLVYKLVEQTKPMKTVKKR